MNESQTKRRSKDKWKSPVLQMAQKQQQKQQQHQHGEKMSNKKNSYTEHFIRV